MTPFANNQTPSRNGLPPNFSLALRSPYTGRAEYVNQCGCEPSNTVSKPGNAAPALIPSTSDTETTAALPGFSLTQSRAFSKPVVAAAEARVKRAPLS